MDDAIDLCKRQESISNAGAHSKRLTMKQQRTTRCGICLYYPGHGEVFLPVYQLLHQFCQSCSYQASLFVTLRYRGDVSLTPIDGPIAPEGMPPSQTTCSLYSCELFTVPRPKYIFASAIDQRLGRILQDPSAHQAEALVAEASTELPDTKRPERVMKLGFFEQGILTGLVLTLTVILTGTGAAGYYFWPNS